LNIQICDSSAIAYLVLGQQLWWGVFSQIRYKYYLVSLNIFEPNVGMFEDKLQNQEQQQKLNAKIDALAEEVDQLRKANTTLVDRLKEAEQKAEMAENEVKIK
jgi:hypothetical protein